MHPAVVEACVGGTLAIVRGGSGEEIPSDEAPILTDDEQLLMAVLRAQGPATARALQPPD